MTRLHRERKYTEGQPITAETIDRLRRRVASARRLGYRSVPVDVFTLLELAKIAEGKANDQN